MASDIVLNDDLIKVVSGRLHVHNQASENGDDGNLWLHAELQEARERTPGGAVSLAVGNRNHSTATMTVTGQDGETRITSTSIRSGTVTGRTRMRSPLGEFESFVADEVNVGHTQSFSEETKPGVLKVKTAGGEASIVLDGASGDITLTKIGSLIAKINDLQRQIDELRG